MWVPWLSFYSFPPMASFHLSSCKMQPVPSESAHNSLQLQRIGITKERKSIEKNETWDASLCKLSLSPSGWVDFQYLDEVVTYFWPGPFSRSPYLFQKIIDKMSDDLVLTLKKNSHLSKMNGLLVEIKERGGACLRGFVCSVIGGHWSLCSQC